MHPHVPVIIRSTDCPACCTPLPKNPMERSVCWWCERLVHRTGPDPDRPCFTGGICFDCLHGDH